MIGGIFARLARVQFTVGYVAVLLAISCAVLALGPHAHDVLVQRASTNLHNLAHGHVGTLLGSALVVDAGPLYFWLPFLTCLLALAELHLRTIQLVVAFVVGHIGATLVVAAALAVLGAMTAVIPARWRAAWVGWWIAAGLASAIIGGDFTDAGHTVAVILGVLVSARFRQPIHWTPVRLLMMVASSGFGFLVLAHHWGTMAAAPVFGVLGALAAHNIVQLVARRNRLVDDTLTGPQPVMTG